MCGGYTMELKNKLVVALLAASFAFSVNVNAGWRAYTLAGLSAAVAASSWYLSQQAGIDAGRYTEAGFDDLAAANNAFASKAFYTALASAVVAGGTLASIYLSAEAPVADAAAAAPVLLPVGPVAGPVAAAPVVPAAPVAAPRYNLRNRLA